MYCIDIIMLDTQIEYFNIPKGIVMRALYDYNNVWKKIEGGKKETCQRDLL